ncbi:hypothetical protein DFH27DRAFT_341906 [Peziza echinospora]|nr:hypothetical protein DFH27DRAFT_341906 [Peziza echinospora]
MHPSHIPFLKPPPPNAAERITYIHIFMEFEPPPPPDKSTSICIPAHTTVLTCLFPFPLSISVLPALPVFNLFHLPSLGRVVLVQWQCDISHRLSIIGIARDHPAFFFLSFFFLCCCLPHIIINNYPEHTYIG